MSRYRAFEEFLEFVHTSLCKKIYPWESDLFLDCGISGPAV